MWFPGKWKGSTTRGRRKKTYIHPSSGLVAGDGRAAAEIINVHTYVYMCVRRVRRVDMRQRRGIIYILYRERANKQNAKHKHSRGDAVCA